MEGTEVRLWDVATGKESGLLKVPPSEDYTVGGPIRSLAWTPDSHTLVTGHKRDVRLWDLPGGKVRAVLKGHEATVTSVAVTSDGKLLATGSEDGTIRLWDLPAGTARVTLKDLERRDDTMIAVAFSRDGTLASARHRRPVLLWDPAAGQKRGELKGPKQRRAVRPCCSARTARS